MTLKDYAALIDETLAELLPEADQRIPDLNDTPWLMENAMRYSVMVGGKRLRPAMLLACADMLGVDRGEALPVACALEMIHTYSLIHDDLPGMDNDVLRRGQPTNHVVFGEGQAILAGDGLLTLAMKLMLENAMAHADGTKRHTLAMNEIIQGAYYMVGGQSMDLYAEREGVRDESLLDYIHMNKTAQMLISPLRAAAALAGFEPDSPEMTALTVYGVKFGLLFQVVDDILDVVGDEKVLGKSIGKDAENGKLTFVTAYGLDGARKKADELEAQAEKSLEVFGEKAAFFVNLLRQMSRRAQ